MTRRISFWLVIAALSTAWLPSAGRAQQEPTLNIGDRAPELVVDHWLHGEAVKPATAGHAVLVEFWATWCGPCIQSIPHLNALQREFAPHGLRVVGFTYEDPNNTLENVKTFVQDRRAKLGYSIAFQESDSTSRAWLDAAGETGLPTAYLVDAMGRIAWIGHPMELGNDLAKRILSGEWDLQLARRKREINIQAMNAALAFDWTAFREKMLELAKLDPTDGAPYLMLLWAYSEVLDDPKLAREAATKALTAFQEKPRKLAELASTLARREDPNGFNVLAGKAVDQAMTQAPQAPEVLLAKFDVLSAMGKPDEARRVAAHAIELMKGDGSALGMFAARLAHPDASSRCHELGLQAVDLAIAAQPDAVAHLQTKFHILWACKQDLPAARSTALYLVNKAGDAGLLNSFAWILLTDEDKVGKFKHAALAAAEKCHSLSGGDNWSFLDTLALAKFETGAIAEAITLEKQAISSCPEGHPALADLQAALQRFEATRKP